MKIQNDKGIPGGIPPQPRPVQGSQLDRPVQASPGQRPTADRVELSDRARALHAAREALSQLPQIRQDRVEALKRLVVAGTYGVPGEKVAERMLAEGLFG